MALFASVLHSVLAFLVLLGILILVHEFGHFLVAKLVGVKVLKFSLGFPPALLKRKWGETEYAIGCIPLGGYVKLYGEDPESNDEIPPEEVHRTFTAKPLWARTAVVAAGPVSNYLLALVVICVGYLAGWPVLAGEVGRVLEGSPAMEAGLTKGDLVVEIDGHKVHDWDDMRALIEERPGKTIPIKVLRDEKEVTLQVTPQPSKEKDPFGNPLGRIGVGPSGRELQLGPGERLVEGCKFTFKLTGMVLSTLVKLAKFEVGSSAIGGPVAIAEASGRTLHNGVVDFIRFLCSISISLAIINLLPIPILDGGHLLFFFVEAVFRRPVIGRVREWATQAGFAIIIFLMGLAFYNDISKLVNKGSTLIP
ncbi:MAG: RIP metalloprotease RseP [Thermodesulfobacteriota bacterium]